MQLNWEPVIESLLQDLAEAGFDLASVDDGGEIFTSREIDKAVKTVCSVDESTITVADKEGRRFWILLVLGNAPFETVCDYRAGSPLLDAVLEAWSDSWEGKPCPTE